MKKILIIGLAFFFSCNSAKKSSSANEDKTRAKQTQCPEQGKCSWELLQNKSMAIKEDGTGAIYPVFAENPNTSVVKFRYHRESPEGMADGQYTEEVYLEVGNDVKKLTLQNENLQKVKLLYRRMCFCERATVGYFEVVDGILEYSKNKNGEVRISLVFENKQVPQTLEKIEGKVVFE